MKGVQRTLCITLIIVLAFSVNTGFATAQAEEEEQRAVTSASSFEQEILELQRLFTEVATLISSLVIRAKTTQEMVDALSYEIANKRITLRAFESILHGQTMMIHENRAQIMYNRDRLKSIALSLEDHETRLAALAIAIPPVPVIPSVPAIPPVPVDLHQQIERLNLFAVIALIASVGAIVLLAGGG